MPMPTVLGPIREAFIQPGNHPVDDDDIAGLGPAKIVPGIERIDDGHFKSSGASISLLNIIYAAVILGAGLFILARNNGRYAKSIVNNVSSFFHCGKNNRPNNQEESDKHSLMGHSIPSASRQY